MENDYNDLEPLIPPEEMSELANSNYWQCYCGYDDYCYCFNEKPCCCFVTPEDNVRFTFGDIGKAIEQGFGIIDFPGVGRLRLEYTSGENNLCGMFALEISTDKQFGVALTPNTFWNIFCFHPEMRAFNEERSWINRNNFYDEQLAGVLGIWGRQNGYGILQLGVIAERSHPMILGAGDKCVVVLSEEDLESERDFKTIWIYNDNAEQLHEAGMNHYSGVTVLELNEEQDESSENGGSTEEGEIKVEETTARETTAEESATETPGDDTEAG